MTDAGVKGSLAVYLAFGLRLRSDLPLPELPVDEGGGGPADVEVRVFHAPAHDVPDIGTGVVDVAEEIAMLWWPGIGRFVVSDGCDICVALAPGVEPATLRRHLLGPVLNTLLHQREWIVLRAGAAKLGDRVIAFIPGPGVVETLIESGYTILARDMLAIRAGDPLTAAVIRRSESPFALDALYVLKGEGGGADPLSREEAFVELGACLLEDVTWPGDLRRALKLMFHLASSLPVHRMSLESLASRDSVRDIRG